MPSSLSSLRTRILKRADMESSSFVDNDEMADYINGSIAGLIDILVEADDDHSLSSYTITTGKNNLIAYSDDFSQSSWTMLNAALSTEKVRNHLGVNSATGVIPSMSNTSQGFQVFEHTPVTEGTQYTWSIYAKKATAGAGWVRLFWLKDASTPDGGAYFNLNTGTIGTISSSVEDAFIEEQDDDWWRIGITFIPTSLTVANTINFMMLLAEADGDSTFAGDAATVHGYFDNAQFTAGTGFDDYIKTTSSAITGQKADRYELPRDCYHLKGVDYIYSSSESQTLLPFNFNERNKYKSPYSNISTSSNIVNYHYRWMGDNLILTPEPENNLSIKVWYYAKPKELVNDTDSLDFHNRYEEWIIIDSAIKCLLKEESSVTALTKEREKVEERIRNAIAKRDTGFSDTMSDISTMNNDFGDNWY